MPDKPIKPQPLLPNRMYYAERPIDSKAIAALKGYYADSKNMSHAQKNSYLTVFPATTPR